MVEKWDKNELNKIDAEKINDDLNDDDDFKKFIQVIIELLRSLEEAKETTRDDFKELIGIIILLGELKPWLNRKGIDSLSTIVQKFKKSIIAAS